MSLASTPSDSDTLLDILAAHALPQVRMAQTSSAISRRNKSSYNLLAPTAAKKLLKSTDQLALQCSTHKFMHQSLQDSLHLLNFSGTEEFETCQEVIVRIKRITRGAQFAARRHLEGQVGLQSYLMCYLFYQANELLRFFLDKSCGTLMWELYELGEAKPHFRLVWVSSGQPLDAEGAEYKLELALIELKTKFAFSEDDFDALYRDLKNDKIWASYDGSTATADSYHLPRSQRPKHCRVLDQVGRLTPVHCCTSDNVAAS